MGTKLIRIKKVKFCGDEKNILSGYGTNSWPTGQPGQEGGSAGPGYSQLHFGLQERIMWAKLTCFHQGKYCHLTLKPDKKVTVLNCKTNKSSF